MYDIEKIRSDFPSLNLSIRGKRNSFLDTAASAQKPQCVLDKMQHFYINYANVHRGAYFLSENITSEYEASRAVVQKFINAKSEREIVFTRSATEAINLVAATWGMSNLKKGDAILLSKAEHHANLVPWQNVRDKTGCSLNFFDLNEDGSFNYDKFAAALSINTKLVGATAMSNITGAIFPVKHIAQEAHKLGALCLVDACQAAAHGKIDVVDLDCDFLAFSGHKIYGPTGVGVLYAKLEVLNAMPPYQFGGDMVKKVTYEETSFADAPSRFEAGTPAIVEAIGLAEAIRYLNSIGWEKINAYENELISYANTKFSEVNGLRIVGPKDNKGGVFSFVLDNLHPQDVAFILDREGVSVRTGHHCAQPFVNHLGYSSLARASFGIYSNREDVDIFINALHKVKSFF